MAFNADEYIDVIVGQIAGNFQELSKTVERKKELDKKKKEFEDSKDSSESEKLSEEIKEEEENYRNIEPLTVGLFGEWGSGKTHLLKLVETKVNEAQADSKDKTFPQITIPVFFNAWRFEKEEHMIIPLFQTMLTTLEEYEHKPFKDEVKTFIRRGLVKLKVLGKSLSSGLKSPDDLQTTALKAVSGDVSAVADVLDTDALKKEYDKKIKDELVTDELFKELTENSRLESVYYKMPQWIEKITTTDNINFIFLIDDLDRCLPENTLKMLESIKLFLDVPSCAFVLAIDDDVVERGVAYHYRDYLQQNNNTIIHLNEEKVENKKAEQQELPITGHEYLEKMIQLPFRIPVIGTDNVLEFLEKNYRERFEVLLEDKEEKQKKEKKEVHKEYVDVKEQNSKTDEILKFFSKTIPPKPRKIKRTAMLFETKVRLLKQIELERKIRLIAKITLLELFVPKLLRFMQNNDYERIYNRLVHFRGIESEKQEETDEKTTLSLADAEAIQKHIESSEAKYTTKEKELFTKLMKIVAESRSSRMIFDLDAIFDKSETQEDLRLNIEMTKAKKKEQTPSKLTNLSETSLKKLFRPNDVASWGDAFKDNKLLAEGEALLSDMELKEIISKAKKKENIEFAKDPEWMGVVAKYISDEQYIQLLKELYEYRFADIQGKFKMGIYQVTFAEYDRYCEVVNMEKPEDQEWGRGKRPVINVNWHDATAYATWLTEQLGIEYKLPKEDEWYLACNNGKNTKWHFGDEEKELKEYAWYSENAERKTHPVGLKKTNALGLYDMHGNVWEWCEDWYYKDKKYKVVRGGSWDVFDYDSLSVIRSNRRPDILSYYIGFRLLRTLP